MRRWPRPDAEALALGALVVLLLGTVLPIGGQSPLVIALAAAGVAVPLVLLARRSRGLGPLGPAWILGGLALYSLLQTVPLPLGTLARLAPRTAEIWAGALSPVAGAVASAPLSLDPGATSLEAAKWALYAAVFAVAAAVARVRGARSVIVAVVGVGVAVAVITIAHQIVGAQRVFGVYEPHNLPGPNRMGPLLNPNHAAGYLLFTGLCGLGLAVGRQRGAPRWLLGAAAITCFAVSLRSASRGGALSLVLGLLVLGLLAVVLERHDERDKAEARGLGALAILGAGLAAIALAVLGFDEALQKELFDTDTGKLRLTWASAALARDHGWLGVGRGAFETAFEPYRPTGQLHVVFTHPENVLMQWVSEWGALGGLGLVGLCVLMRPWALGLREKPSHAGAAAAAFALGVHNLADFSLELPGPAVAFAAVLGALWGASRSRRQSRRPRLARGAALGWATALCALAALGFSRGAPSVADSRRELSALFEASAKDAAARERLVALLPVRLARHPADYFPSMMGAAAALRDGGNAGPWIVRAVTLGPSVGRVHLLLAELLIRRGGKAQALLELRLALENEPGLAPFAARSALAWTREADELERAAPPDAAGGLMLEALATEALQLRLPELARDLDRRALRREPSRRVPRERLAQAALDAITTHTCEDLVACEAEVTEHAEALTLILPGSPLGARVLARLDEATGDRVGARDRLRVACNRPQERKECWMQLAALEEGKEFDDLVDRVIASSCARPPACAQALTWASVLYAGRRAIGTSLTLAQRAAEQEATRERWERVAALASQSGEEALAMEARRKAAALPAP